jgi:hypothetical protein
MAFNISGSLAATGSTEGHAIAEPFYIEVSGTWVGTWALEARASSSSAWVNCLNPDGTNNAFAGNGRVAVPNVYGDLSLFRITFTRTSGTLEWRLFR